MCIGNLEPYRIHGFSIIGDKIPSTACFFFFFFCLFHPKCVPISETNCTTVSGNFLAGNKKENLATVHFVKSNGKGKKLLIAQENTACKHEKTTNKFRKCCRKTREKSARQSAGKWKVTVDLAIYVIGDRN